MVWNGVICQTLWEQVDSSICLVWNKWFYSYWSVISGNVSLSWLVFCCFCCSWIRKRKIGYLCHFYCFHSFYDNPIQDSSDLHCVVIGIARSSGCEDMVFPWEILERDTREERTPKDFSTLDEATAAYRYEFFSTFCLGMMDNTKFYIIFRERFFVCKISMLYGFSFSFFFLFYLCPPFSLFRMRCFLLWPFVLSMFWWISISFDHFIERF